MVKNPPSSAGDTGLIRGWGIKIPHASEVLSPHTATRESVLSKACAPQQEKLFPSHTYTHTHTPRNKDSAQPEKKNKHFIDKCPCP